MAMQQHMAQQAAFAAIPDVVKGVRCKKKLLHRLFSLCALVYRAFPPSCSRQ
jgi:hypothetical protein